MSRTLLAARRAVAPVIGVSFASSADRYIGGAGSLNNGPKWITIRGRLDQQAVDGLAAICGINVGVGGGGPWILIREATGFGQGRIVADPQTYTDLYTHRMTTAEVGTYHVWQIVLDTVRQLQFLYCDDHIQGFGAANANASLGGTGNLGINTRSSAGGTFAYGAMTLVEIQCSTHIPTPAEVIANVHATPGTLVTGAVNRWLASSLGSVGGTPGAWVDSIGGVSLTKTGAPTLVSVLPVSKGYGTIEMYGDSRVKGKIPTGFGNGFRKPIVDAIVAGGRSIACVGQFSVDAQGTQDWDGRNTSVASQALGVVTTQPSRLSTLAADVALNCPADGITLMAYGVNDLSQRINVLAQSPSDAVAAYFADIVTAAGIIAAARTGPIFWTDIGLTATGSSTANERTGQALANAGLPAQIAALGAQHHYLPLFAAAIPNQAAADNIAILWDGVHLTDPLAVGLAGAAGGAGILAALG